MSSITILMPVYNGEKFLSQAITSILEQSYNNFKFLVIDDGSTDESARILQSFTDPRMWVIRHNSNKGLTYSLNHGLSLIDSEYIARMDADDISLPQRLEMQLRYLRKHNDVGAVGSALIQIDDRGRKLRSWQPPLTHSEISWCLGLYSPMAHPSVLMRRSAIEQVGGYNETMATAQDHDLWYRLSKFTKLSNIPIPLLHLRRHSASVTSVRHSEHLNNRIKTLSIAFWDYLNDGKFVSQNGPSNTDNKVMHCIYMPKNTSEEYVLKAILLLQAYLKRGLEQENLARKERYFMKKDIARMLIQIGMANFRQRAGILAIAKALQIEPLALVVFLRKKL